MSQDRYARCFARLKSLNQGAFIPFVTVGDPDLALSLQIIEALIAAGADALELGLPFSDPIADGPVIQAASQRALASGVKTADCWALIATVRARHPELPIGLLVYANLVYTKGVEHFYAQASAAGVDSVLVADVPTEELAPFAQAAQAATICPVLIATPSADEARLRKIAASSRGYTYVVTRQGVTGADETLTEASPRALLARLRAQGSPPAVMGFGISKPEHVQQVLRMGAAGAISGSAIVSRIAALQHDPPQLLASLDQFVRQMKAATALV